MPGTGATGQSFVDEARGWLEQDNVDPSGSAGAGDTVLVVDEDPDMRDYLCRLLGPRYAIQLAATRAEAYRSATENPPGAVISDVMMPGPDGFRLLHDLRSDPRTKNVPVILVSARADVDSTVEALQFGADDYLVKPFGARELLARLGAVLETSRNRGRAAERGLRQDELRSLLNDLKSAQSRLVAAGDAERRRIERDLHDGAQQRLVAIRIELGLLCESIERDPMSARVQLDRLRVALDEALDELRELAHGLYPPLLASDGLGAALSAAARQAGIPVEIDASEVPRLPGAIENAVYFCCLEALQNSAKHAGEQAHVSIRLVLRHGALEFRVADDGVGFDREAVADGYGLTNVRDRLAALGGEAVVTSTPGKGTTVAGQVPLA